VASRRGGCPERVVIDQLAAAQRSEAIADAWLDGQDEPFTLCEVAKVARRLGSGPPLNLLGRFIAGLASYHM